MVLTLECQTKYLPLFLLGAGNADANFLPQNGKTAEDLANSDISLVLESFTKENASGIIRDRSCSITEREEYWEADELVDNCNACEIPFSLLRRKHHCRGTFSFCFPFSTLLTPRKVVARSFVETVRLIGFNSRHKAFSVCASAVFKADRHALLPESLKECRDIFSVPLLPGSQLIVVQHPSSPHGNYLLHCSFKVEVRLSLSCCSFDDGY